MTSDIGHSSCPKAANNPKSVLGADDGKGLATIIYLIQEIENNKNNPNFQIPNITICLSSVEEALGYSFDHYLKQNGSIEHLCPKHLKNLCFLNIDSASGRQIDIYRDWDYREKNHISGPSKLEQFLVQSHKMYLTNTLKVKSKEEDRNLNAGSDALTLMNSIINKMDNEYLRNMDYFSLAAHSENMHSPNEEIDLIELDKFNKYFVSLCESLSKYKAEQKDHNKNNNNVLKNNNNFKTR